MLYTNIPRKLNLIRFVVLFVWMTVEWVVGRFSPNTELISFPLEETEPKLCAYCDDTLLIFGDETLMIYVQWVLIYAHARNTDKRKCHIHSIACKFHIIHCSLPSTKPNQCHTQTHTTTASFDDKHCHQLFGTCKYTYIQFA